jgi:response regulator NasT
MRILIADDEPASARALKELLELDGHQVIGPAPDGAEAVRLAGSDRPDLAILDIDMPRMSGLEAIEHISRARPIPVIVLTAHGDAEYVTRAAALPVFTYLRKPSGAGELLPAIRLAAARFGEWKALNGRVGELSARMEERKTIERAKGILMEIRGIAEGEAYRLLQRESQQRSKSMVEIARTIISAQGVFRRSGAGVPPRAAGA